MDAIEVTELQVMEKAMLQSIRELQGSSRPWMRAWGWVRNIISTFTEHPWFDHFMLFVVVVNVSILVVQTIESNDLRDWYFSVVEAVFFYIYLMECVLKHIVWGRLYYKNPWNDLDIVIVTLSVLNAVFNRWEISETNEIFKGVRALRAFRILRAIRFIPMLQNIARVSLRSLQAIWSLLLLNFLVVYVFAVIFCNMYREYDAEHFGNLWETMLTLFELLTLDDWYETYTTSRDRGAPYILIFIVLYIVIEYFIILNLAAVVILDYIEVEHKKSNASKIKQPQDKVKTEELLASGPQTEGFVDNTLEPPSTEEDTSGAGYSDQPTQREREPQDKVKTEELLASGPQTEGFVDNTLEPPSTEEDTSGAGYSDQPTQREREHLRLLSTIREEYHTYLSQARASELLIDTFFGASDYRDDLEE